jgi:DNA-binding SARP family transcriptional activator/nucleoside-triphosphatase THEP1
MTYAIIGPLEVRGPDGPIDLGTPKQRALLALLVLDANRVVPLDRLVDQLWGGEPPSRAEGAVHAYVSHLRRILEPDRPARAAPTVLLSRSPGYLLACEPGDVDAHVFERLAAEGRRLLDSGQPAEAADRLGEALDMWRGAALGEFADEPWAAVPAARLGDLRAVAVEDHVDAMLGLGRHDSMSAELDGLVAENPLRERLWAQLMLALYRSGRQADALRAYQAARTRLGDELGIEPSPDLKRLERAILEQAPDLDWRAPTLQPPTPQSSAPTVGVPIGADEDAVVGRERELTLLSSTVDAVLAGRSQVVVVTGEAGVGKTRLAETTAHLAGQRGVAVGWGSCVEGDVASAFWPWSQAFETGGIGEEDMAAVADGQGSAPGSPDPAARARACERVVRELCGRAEATPLVVVIDDLQWADVASHHVLRLLLTRLSGLSLLLIVTVRDGEDPSAELTLSLATLARHPAARRLELAGLDAAAVGSLIEALTQQQPSAEAIAAFHRRTGGNPFYVGELARLLVSEGRPVEGAALEGAVPGSVRDVVRRRLARLPEQAVSLLAVASVLGRDFDAGVLETIAGVDDDSVLDVLELASISGLVVEAATVGRFSFRHDLVREAIAEPLSELRRARLHARAAEALERSGRADEAQLHEIALHAWEARSVLTGHQVVAALRASAQAATGHGLFEHSERQLCRALELCETTPPTERDRLELDLQLDLGTVLSFTHGLGSPAAGAAFTRARQLAGRSASAEAITLTLNGLARYAIAGGDLDGASTAAGQLIDMEEEASDQLAGLYGHLTAGGTDYFRGRLVDADAHLARSAAYAETIEAGGRHAEAGAQARAIALGLRSIVVAMRGDLEMSSRLARSATTVAADHKAAVAVAMTNCHAALAAALAQDFELCGRYSQEAIDVSQRGGMLEFAAVGAALGGWSAGRLGAGEDSLSQVRQARSQVAATGSTITLTNLAGLEADLLLLAGHGQEAGRTLRVAIGEAQAMGHMAGLPEMHRLLALCLGGVGDLPAALVALEECIVMAESQGATLFADRGRATLQLLGLTRPGQPGG